MAKSEKKEQVLMVKVKCLVNLKYDREVKKMGEELQVRSEDVKGLVKRELVEPMEDFEVKEDNPENEDPHNPKQ